VGADIGHAVAGDSCERVAQHLHADHAPWRRCAPTSKWGKGHHHDVTPRSA
jgi:hypothetical protein